jgi:sRNA-binding carbon storage regulator CsrA
MLILTRDVMGRGGKPLEGRKNEIAITTPAGERIVLHLFPASGARVRVGLDCPKTMTIVRGELEEAKAA